VTTYVTIKVEIQVDVFDMQFLKCSKVRILKYHGIDVKIMVVICKYILYYMCFILLQSLSIVGKYSRYVIY